MQSIWTDYTQIQNQEVRADIPPLKGKIHTDVLVVGGGMTGVLCAYFLKQRGVDCVLVEKNTLGSGVTQNTTAKITAQHGLIYHTILKQYGVNKARWYFDANCEAIEAYRKLADKYPCDFEEKTAFVYSVDRKKELEEEARAYQTLNIEFHTNENPPLPFRTVGALGIPKQAQFHPLKLLYALATEIPYYEHTMINMIHGRIATTHDAEIEADKIIIATHFPMINIQGLYFLKLYQHRSYVIALENGADMQGMYVDEREDGHSFRNYHNMLLLGGGDHKTGKRGGGFEEIRRLAKAAYPDAHEHYAWATQDCMTLDGIPYIGRHSAKLRDLYVATGYNKWGMTGSMIAANMLAEMMIEGESFYSELFSPQRKMFRPQLFTNGLSAFAGFAHLSKPRCTHMGCALQWNEQEHTWDCPCHGSRFDHSGHVIENPAQRDIEHE